MFVNTKQIPGSQGPQFISSRYLPNAYYMSGSGLGTGYKGMNTTVSHGAESLRGWHGADGVQSRIPNTTVRNMD